MTRISRPQLFMEIAGIVAKRSTCARLNVGAVITAQDRIVSIGYNGAGAGQPHCAGNECEGIKGPCRLTLHAEANALDYMPPLSGDLALYVTDSPCLECAWRIHDANIAKVYFGKLYRVEDGINFLLTKDVDVYQVLPAGYTLNWRSKQLE